MVNIPYQCSWIPDLDYNGISSCGVWTRYSGESSMGVLSIHDDICSVSRARILHRPCINDCSSLSKGKGRDDLLLGD